MSKPKYKRVLLKLSGEALAGDKGFGINNDVVNEIAVAIKKVQEIGVEVAVVVGEFSEVERPNYVKVKALNEKGEEFILEGEGLLARAILHENDHLNGVLYVDLVK